ncbi:MAG: 16S rRNA (guanine(966)-N(2))-methyltransferase RsmD [Clostridia bacterium]|nr:16S rRNA (guanine(966)-N(2))-methyltransferase RsmD [Clostridia bacterium]
MRIITGSARGANIITLEGEHTRPTAERTKEALFSMLQFEIEGRKVLDLFAGSGQLGLEALSRGAAHCTFIDNTREAVDIVIKNAKNVKLFDRARVSSVDYAAFLKSAAGKEQYDIIFLDPPYDAGYMAKALRLIADGDLLAYGGKIVCETDNGEMPRGKKKAKKEDDPAKVTEQVFGGDAELEARFEICRTALYGRARITLLSNKDEAESAE